MKANCTLRERGFAFHIARIGKTTLDRADRLACLVIIETDALCTEVRVDDVNVRTFADCLVRALGFTSPTVDAIRRDKSCHKRLSI